MAVCPSAPSSREPVPVLAICATGLRCAGLVALTRQGGVQKSKLLYLRALRTDAERLAAMARETEALLHTHNVAIVAVEPALARRRRLRTLHRAVAVVCRRRMVWMREVPLASALRRLGAENRQEAALKLAAGYPELAAQLDLTGPRLLGSRDHERELRTLVDAFLLAHVVSAERQPQHPSHHPSAHPPALCPQPTPASS